MTDFLLNAFEQKEVKILRKHLLEKSEKKCRQSGLFDSKSWHLGLLLASSCFFSWLNISKLPLYHVIVEPELNFAKFSISLSACYRKKILKIAWKCIEQRFSECKLGSYEHISYPSHMFFLPAQSQSELQLELSLFYFHLLQADCLSQPTDHTNKYNLATSECAKSASNFICLYFIMLSYILHTPP